MKVVIVDYDLGNLFSVQNACKFVGLETELSANPSDVEKADAVILPGVGAFGDAMNNMNASGLSDAVRNFIRTGKPFLGVCLGMQLLFTGSEEFGQHRGLDIIQGNILRFPRMDMNGKKIRVPQIGWNRIFFTRPTGEIERSPMKGVNNGTFMYFVHSYYAMPADPEVMLTRTDYQGIEYCSSVLKDNVFAAQFHPEKSAKEGIEVYKKWAQNLQK